MGQFDTCECTIGPWPAGICANCGGWRQAPPLPHQPVLTERENMTEAIGLVCLLVLMNLLGRLATP